MKTLTIRISFCLAIALMAPSALRADKPDFPGVWCIWGGESLSNADKPWCKGTLLAEGRSVPGAPQKNDREVNFWAAGLEAHKPIGEPDNEG